MINEDIITSLKNAIERGETIETAISIAIRSGYNIREVEEAAKFVGGGIIEIERLSKEQLLSMPNKKSFFQNFFGPRKTKAFIPQKPENIYQNATKPVKKQQIIQVQPIQVRPTEKTLEQQVKPFPEAQTLQEIKQNINSFPPLQSQSSTPSVITKPPRQSYVKEIILLAILLVLIIILILVFKFRDNIIGFFSG